MLLHGYSEFFVDKFHNYRGFPLNQHFLRIAFARKFPQNRYGVMNWMWHVEGVKAIMRVYYGGENDALESK